MALNLIPGGGRPRTPTADKDRRGTSRADRRNPLEPRVEPVAIPSAPRHLTERQRKAWRAFARLLGPMKIVGAPDLWAFELLVKSWVIVALAEESLARPLGFARRRKLEKPTDDGATEVVGETYDAGPLLVVEEGALGGLKIKRRPELDIIAQHTKLLLFHFSRFGLTPADRSRVEELEASDLGEGGEGGRRGLGEFEDDPPDDPE